MATASAFSSLRFSLRTQHRQHKHKHVVRVSKANTHCQSCSCTLARCCRRRHCLLDRTHTHSHRDRHTHTGPRTHSHETQAGSGGDATIVPLKKVGTKPRLINCQQCECDGYTTHNSAPANCVLRARHCLCMRVQAGNACVLCVFVCCGELLWKSAGALSRCTKWGPGPVSEQRMMTDLLVRLFCHTHTCHNLPRLHCAALLWRCRCRCRWLSAPFLLLLPCVCFSTLFAQRRRRRRVRSVRSFEIYLALAKRRRLIGSPLSLLLPASPSSSSPSSAVRALKISKNQSHLLFSLE